MARKPYKFTERKRQEYLELLREGSRRGAAAESVGVTRQTTVTCMRENGKFNAAVDQAEMDANELVEGALFKAAMGGNVVACQVWLYNRMPDKWADKRNIKIAGDPDHPIDIRMMTDDELKRHTGQLANRIAKYIGGEFSDDGDGG